MIPEIQRAVEGEILKGIPIVEDNRATVYEQHVEGAAQLQKYMQTNYINKGVRAVLVGVVKNDNLRYAVYVQPGFLRATEPE